MEIIDFGETLFDSSIYYKLNIFNYKFIADNIKLLLKRNKIKNCDTFIILENDQINEYITLEELNNDKSHYFNQHQRLKINSGFAYYYWTMAHPYILQNIILGLQIPLDIKGITANSYAQIAAYRYFKNEYNFVLPEINLINLKIYMTQNAEKIIKDIIDYEKVENRNDVLTALGAFYLGNKL